MVGRNQDRIHTNCIHRTVFGSNKDWLNQSLRMLSVSVYASQDIVIASTPGKILGAESAPPISFDAIPIPSYQNRLQLYVWR